VRKLWFNGQGKGMKRNRGLQWLTLAGVAVFLTSCTCNKPYSVRAVQEDDKLMSCKDVVLAINETEQYRVKAINTRGITPDQALLPLCWMPTYLSAQDAVSAADERMQYLWKIYDILDCRQKMQQQSMPMSPMSGMPPAMQQSAPPPYRPGVLPTMRRPMPTFPPPGEGRVRRPMVPAIMSPQ
jgi:hypothetical protein